MRTTAAIAALLLTAAPSGRPARAREDPPLSPVRVLFVGNSYTYVNNLPAILADLGRQARPRRPIETEMVVRPGATLARHWADGVALDRIRSSRWDFVVLQEQSLLGWAQLDGRPVVNRPDYFQRYARLFDREIRAAGAKTVLYLTWAARAAPGDQGALDAAYLALAREIGAMVAPVGIAWAQVRESDPRIDLFLADGRHPSPAGSYLAACVLWATLFDETPGGLPAHARGRLITDPEANSRVNDSIGTLVDLAASDAAILQRAAWQAHRARLTTWGPPPAGVDTPTLPRGRRFDPDELLGAWVGRFAMYDSAGSAVELVITRVDGGWSGQWSVEYPEGLGHGVYRLTDLAVSDSGLSFTVADERVVGQSEVHRAVLVGTELLGVAELGSALEPPHFVGHWTLRRK